MTRVIDGDTIEVSSEGGPVKIRLIGVDCPESRRNAKCAREGGCEAQLPAGLKAKARTEELTRARIRLEGKGGKDKYGRTLAYVRTGEGKDLGLVLIQEGLCASTGSKYPHLRSREYGP